MDTLAGGTAAGDETLCACASLLFVQTPNQRQQQRCLIAQPRLQQLLQAGELSAENLQPGGLQAVERGGVEEAVQPAAQPEARRCAGAVLTRMQDLPMVFHQPFE
ncbi:hypothetical protein Q3H58_003005 [Pseudomonas psychrotolerans]|nr:hypothetical protein [Pseudomonas psychrotolerans]